MAKTNKCDVSSGENQCNQISLEGKTLKADKKGSFTLSEDQQRALRDGGLTVNVLGQADDNEE